jgi:hypothetical protein
MEFVLSYSGAVKSSRDRKITSSIRKSISAQLERLGRDERLKGAFNRLSNVDNTIQGSSFFSGTRFIPVFGVATLTTVELDITLLNGSDYHSPLKNGDLDNRLKRVIDGLRCPLTGDEVDEGTLFDQKRCFCLINDDSILSKISVRAFPNLSANSESDTVVLINAKVKAFGTTWENSSFCS